MFKCDLEGFFLFVVLNAKNTSAGMRASQVLGRTHLKSRTKHVCLCNEGTSFSAPIASDPVTLHPVLHFNFHFSF